MMSKGKAVGLIIIVFIAGALVNHYIYIRNGNATKQEQVSRYTEIYSAVCPFGVFMVDGSGAFILGSGGFNIGTEETYVIKYFDSKNVLKSISLNADDSVIIIDGTFRFEVIEWHHVTYRNHKAVSKVLMDHWNYPDSYLIHLPYLPTPAYNITSSFIFGDS